MGKWEEVKLGKLCQIIGGGTPSKSNKEFYTGQIPWASVRDMGTETIEETEFKITEEAVKKSSTNIIKEGSIIIATRVGLGKVCFAGKDIAINQDLKGIIVNDLIENKYLFFYFKSIEQFLIDSGTGATVKGVKLDLVKNLIIPLPPLLEQQRIVTKLDVLFADIDEAIGLLEENIAHTQALMGSVLDEEFGKLEKLSSKKEKLKNITSKIGSGATPRGGQKSYKETGISLIRSMNVHDCFFKKKNLAFIDDEQADKLKNVEILENDVLLNITGASVARCCIVDSSYLPARVNQHVSIIRTDVSVLPEFMLYFLVSPKMKSKLLYDSAGNATREAITKSMIESIEVPIVSIENQQRLIDKIKESFRLCDELTKTETQKLNHLRSLKSSLLDQAFKGEL